nr:hypothetical protein StreXyl84_47990 [Streptomyces sp. Xyl84]
MASTACAAPARLRDRARGALLGLAVGDALGAPAENLRPSEIRARWGRVTGYVTDHPAGTDDTEYALFSGLLLARHGAALTPADVEAAWHEHITVRAEAPFRGAGFSERGTLENLRRGLAAPVSAQHRHAWSDGLAMRAAPFGVFAAGRPAEAARLVAVDGSVSHEGEGIHGGRAVAAGVAAAMAGAPPVAVVAAALAVVPDDSWTARSLRRATAAAHRGERAVRSAVVIAGYPWSDLAPEAVALAFGAYAAADGDFRDAVLTAVNMGRDADTTAAVAGALAGATQGVTAIPEEWAAPIGPARGSCLPSVAGRHVLEVADLLLTRAAAAGHPAAPARPAAGAPVRDDSPAPPPPGTPAPLTTTATTPAPATTAAAAPVPMAASTPATASLPLATTASNPTSVPPAKTAPAATAAPGTPSAPARPDSAGRPGSPVTGQAGPAGERRPDPVLPAPALAGAAATAAAPSTPACPHASSPAGVGAPAHPRGDARTAGTPQDDPADPPSEPRPDPATYVLTCDEGEAGR